MRQRGNVGALNGARILPEHESCAMPDTL